jgi:RNA polymerase sigma-70 factor (sigma-E family)
MRREAEGDPVGGELERLLAERGNWLMAIALALTGDRADAEDLLQAALERLLRHRRGITTSAEAYLRRTLYNLAADGWRRRGAWRRKISVLRAEHLRAGAGAVPDGTATVDLRDELVRLLLQLPPHQRAVILLRYWEQLTTSETADVLGCSEGAVKSAASKGLHRLRDLAGGGPGGPIGSGGGTQPAAGQAGESAAGHAGESGSGEDGAAEPGQEGQTASARVTPGRGAGLGQRPETAPGQALIRLARERS